MASEERRKKKKKTFKDCITFTALSPPPRKYIFLLLSSLFSPLSVLQLCANKLGDFIKKLAINQLHSSKDAQPRSTSLNIRPMLTDSSKVVWYVCTYACKCVSHTLQKGQSAPAWKEDSSSKENTFYLPLETSAFQG